MAKIFLDDNRAFPDASLGYNCVQNYEECILLVDAFKNNIEFITLDYDLHSEYTGLNVLQYMVEHKIEPQHINIHSNHYAGIETMKEYAEQNFPNTKVTTRSF